MVDYQLYHLDKVSQLVTSEQFDAADDMSALAYAQERWSEADCELWRDGCRVALVLRLDLRDEMTCEAK